MPCEVVSGSKEPWCVPGSTSATSAEVISHSAAVHEILGAEILSTSQGIKTNYEAYKENLGGEVLCLVY